MTTTRNPVPKNIHSQISDQKIIVFYDIFIEFTNNTVCNSQGREEEWPFLLGVGVWAFRSEGWALPSWFGVGPCPSFLRWWWRPLPSCCGSSSSFFRSGVGPSFSGLVGWPFLLGVRVGPSFSGLGFGPCPSFFGGGWPFLLAFSVRQSILEWELALLGMEVGPLPSGGGNWVPSQPFLLVVGVGPSFSGWGFEKAPKAQTSTRKALNSLEQASG